ncbi:MAG: LOG family protein, partial [Candidatus Omnitrophica bacterium]|nr:LOG family protein [Candidatus Omnitrophota bacterium]
MDTSSKTASLFINHDYKKYLKTQQICINARYKFIQKVILIRHANLGFVFFPGGLETLDVLFDVLCLIQTGKIKPVPVMLMGRRFWVNLDYWLRNRLLPFGVISSKDLNIYSIVDTPQDVLEIINRYRNLNTNIASSPLDDNAEDLINKIKHLSKPVFNLSQYLSLIMALEEVKKDHLEVVEFLRNLCFNSEILIAKRTALDVLLKLLDRVNSRLAMPVVLDFLKDCDYPDFYKRMIIFLVDRFSTECLEDLENLKHILPSSPKRRFIGRALEVLKEKDRPIFDEEDVFIEFVDDILKSTHSLRLKMLHIATGTAGFVRQARRHTWARGAEILATDIS